MKRRSSGSAAAVVQHFGLWIAGRGDASFPIRRREFITLLRCAGAVRFTR